MENIEIHEMSEAFLKCWTAAGKYLNVQAGGGIQTWLKAEPSPPFLEHLSFRLGNQLFFIRVQDVSGKVLGPGSERGLLAVAESCRGYACLLPMKKKLFGGWVPAKPGWGLVDAKSGHPIDPPSLITDEMIEMTPWELQDMAVQVVRQNLQNQGFHILSWQGNPQVDPSIWFVGKSQKAEWVVVRFARFPDGQATRPSNWSEIADRCSPKSKIGHFASVVIVNSEQSCESRDEPALPLWRGGGMNVRYEGLSREA